MHPSALTFRCVPLSGCDAKLYAAMKSATPWTVSRPCTDDSQTSMFSGPVQVSWRLDGERLPFRRAFSDRLVEQVTKPIRIYISGAHATGKCVAGNTLIPTSGGVLRASEVFSERPKMADSESGSRAIKSRHDEGVTATTVLETESGYRIEARPNHRIRVLTDAGIAWSPMDHIRCGDAVVLSRANSTWSSRETIPEDEAELIGAWTGDGWFDRRAVMFSVGVNKDQYARERLIPMLQRLGHKSWIRTVKGRANILYVSKRTGLYERWVGYGLVHGSAKKVVPDIIRKSSKRVIAAFLRGWFGTDGCAYGYSIEAATTSGSLAEDIQTLLLMFGVVSSRAWKSNDSSGVWTIYVKWNSSKEAFVRNIGMGNQYKVEESRRIVRELGEDLERIPGTACLVRMAWDGLKGKVKNRKPYSCFYRARWGHHDLTWKQLAKFVELGGAESLPSTLRDIWEKHLFVEKVERISSSQAHCYDLTVAGDPSYISNGFISHNTTLARWISKAYGLPIVSEVARAVLSEYEVSFEALRSDIEKTAEFQAEVFKRQAAAEDKAGDNFVSDRAFDNLAYAASHTISLNNIMLCGADRYAERLKRAGSVVFFVRPHKSLLVQDGTRELLDWDEIVRIDGMIRLLFELHDIDFVSVCDLSMSCRVRTVRAVLKAAGLGVRVK